MDGSDRELVWLVAGRNRITRGEVVARRTPGWVVVSVGGVAGSMPDGDVHVTEESAFAASRHARE